MNEETPLIEELQKWFRIDPLVYQCLTMQESTGLSDRATLVALVTMMADRHQHLEASYKNLLKRVPPSPYVNVKID